MDDRRDTETGYQEAAGPPETQTAPIGEVETPGVAAALSDLSSIHPDSLPRVVREQVLALINQVNTLENETLALRARMTELESLADTDPLLPVLNRRAFTREISRAIYAVNRYGAQAALIYLDLNGFKAVNDLYGHDTGDETLRHVARLLVKTVRETDIVGRLGGDEFGLLLTHTDMMGASLKADALNPALMSDPPLSPEGDVLALSIAYGVIELAPGQSAEDVLKQADAAMYAKKSAMKQASSAA